MVLLKIIIEFKALLLSLRHIAISYFKALVAALIQHLGQLCVQLVVDRWF